MSKSKQPKSAKQPKVPGYCLHKPSGRGYSDVGGKQHYFPGKHGSKESVAAYEKFIADYLANGRQLPPSFLRPGTVAMTCEELGLRFLDWAKVRYSKDSQGFSHCRVAMYFLIKYFGKVPVNDFLPISLEYLQERMLVECAELPGTKKGSQQKGYARQTINRHIARIKKAFKRGVANKWVDPQTHYALQSVESLKLGQTEAPEYKKIPPVAIDVVKKTLPFIKSNVVRDMARVQLHMGGRPQDVINMRACDIDRTPRPDGTWVYIPYTHKTAHRGKSLHKAINPQAQAILLSYLLANEDTPEAFLFSPKESMQQQSIERRKNRKTFNKQGQVQPSQRNRSNKSNRKRPPGDQYLVSSYYHAIRSACKRAGVPPWSPNQLRHTAGTEARKLSGAESAQAFLGHENLNTTEIYAEKNFAEAAKVAVKIGEVLKAI